MTNDLNDKDDLIVKLKREVAALERTVFIKEKEHEQDSIVKVQLGKRLEQVLLDKEEAYEELEQLQVRFKKRIYFIFSCDLSNLNKIYIGCGPLTV